MNEWLKNLISPLAFPISNKRMELGVLALDGTDAKKLLQGQTTCEMHSLADDKALYGAICNVQGRIICNFYALQDKDRILLIMNQSLIEKTVDHLKKYAIFFKTDIVDVSSQWCVSETFNHASSSISERIDEGKKVTKVDQSYRISICDYPIEHRFILTPANEITTPLLENNDAFSWLRLLNGEYLINLQQTEMHLPQTLNMQRCGGINFKKGCYIGQEIVARLQYRGKVKSSMALFISTHPIPAPFQSISDNQGNKIGTVVTDSQLTTGSLILALVPSDSHLKAFVNNQQLLPLDFPYTSNANGENH